MSRDFDVIVVGAGPGGYVAAIRCAQLGLKVACVDEWIGKKNKPSPGGTCLNVGCIPSKALLESSEYYKRAIDNYGGFGVRLQGIELDLATMMSRKDQIVSDLTQGISALFEANGIEMIHGRGVLMPDRHIEITEIKTKATRTIGAENIILATGSNPVEIDGARLHENLIVDSAGALEFAEVPGRVGVIGAGVIGLELGSVWSRLGAEVILLEAQDDFLAMADEQLAKIAMKEFTKQGLDIRLGARVVSSDVEKTKVTVKYQQKKKDFHEVFDKLIVAVGRRPNTVGIFTEETELLLDEWSLVHVDQQCRTNLPGVYAIGDMVRGPMLAHKASEEGMMVAEIIVGKHAEVNYDNIPSVIYTHPEIAWVGKTEQELRASGTAYRSGSFPFAASGRARAMGDTTVMIKMLSEEKTDRVLGVHMIGPCCSELISQAVIAMEFGASSEDIAMTVFAHPTLTESFHEAALAVDNRAIHIAQRRRN